MKKKFCPKVQRLLTVIVLMLYLLSNLCVNGVVSAKNNTNDSYSMYYENNTDFNVADSDILLVPENILGDITFSSEYKDIVGSKQENAIVYGGNSGEIVYKVNIPTDALYTFSLNYLPLTETDADIKIGIQIDGEYPFERADSLVLPHMWCDSDDKRFDLNGNEFVPEQLVLKEFVLRELSDPTGIENLPYRFALDAGEHTISLTFGEEPVVIDKAALTVPCGEVKYSQVSDEWKKLGIKGANETEAIILEAEDTYYKSARSIVSKSDTASLSVNPSSATEQKINYIGSSNWSKPGEEIVWKVYVKKAGLYRLGFNYKQDLTVNGNSYRILKIDGKIPFAEATSLKFYYSSAWKYTELLMDSGDPLCVYLDEGEHTLSLAATMGETAEHYRVLESITEELSDLYLDIVMITGSSPDSNRDYDLFNQIDDFNAILENNRDRLHKLAESIKKQNKDGTTSLVTSINNMARILNSMVENPYTAQNYVSDYYTNYTTLSSWLYDMKSMPLSLDRIYIFSADNDFCVEKPNVFKRIGFGIKKFIISFIKDYNGWSADEEENENELTIWVNWGRDQAQVLNSLIQEDFTPSTDIAVNLKLTDASLVRGILAGNAPDLALHLARTEPVNLAMRGALYDLTKFDDYEEVLKSFGGSASVPYVYGNGVYALPDTQSFYIMFYRKDVLEKLGISVPETWDEFLAATAVLQRNNMQVWIPYTQIAASTTVNTGVGGLNLFASILQQFGNDFYNKDRNVCLLDTPEAQNAFTFWTDMYTKYKMPTSASFYSRFRLGTMPLCIDVYTNYTMLKEAAPEIDGKWGIGLVPGVKKEDGTVDHSVSGAGTGCSIISSCNNKDEAWEFLKWWTSAETQLDYNDNVESILGAVSRTTTANLKAFEGMSWDNQDLDTLMAQREWISEIPEVPGSYYVTRAVDQAFWQVINGESRPKDALDEWTDIANSEIERKIKQYGAN